MIEEKVRLINEKYGIQKRWRAKMGKEYFYIDDYCEITSENDFFYVEDNARYCFGNYFEKEEEAQEYAKYIKKCSLEWHEKRENNE